MVFLFFPSRVRCRSCDQVGRSVINRLYWISFFAGVGFSAFLLHDGISSGIIFGGTETAAGVVVAWLCLKTLVTPNAHRCRSCGGAFVEPAA